MTLRKSFIVTVLITGLFLPGISLALDVNITADLPSVQVLHKRAAQTRLPGPQIDLVSRRHAGLGGDGIDHG